MWPTGMDALGVPVSGRLPGGERAEPGRAVGRLTDIGWGNRLRDLLGTGVPDQEVPEDLFQACVQVLAAWQWEQRPVGVVAIGSNSRPLLVRSLARRIAEIGRLPLLGEVATNPGTTPRRGNSAQRVGTLRGQFTIPEELAATVSGLDGPVLLMDDYADTGWTAAIVARTLRLGGAPAVLPFTLASTG